MKPRPSLRAWYGLRLSADGKPSPYPVVIFGGLHADKQIGPAHGQAVAESGSARRSWARDQGRMISMEEETVRGVLSDISAERWRQINEEGWSPEHDDDHDKGELANAAACYAIGDPMGLWPWELSWFKLGDRRRNLVKAGALIIAEIERLDRAGKHHD